MKNGSKSIKKYTCYTVLAAVYFGILAYHWIYVTIYPLDRLFTFLAMLIYSDVSTQIGYHLSKRGHRSILGAFVCGVFPQVLYSIIIYGRYYKLMLTLCLLVTLIVCLFVIPSVLHENVSYALLYSLRCIDRYLRRRRLTRIGSNRKRRRLLDYRRRPGFFG